MNTHSSVSTETVFEDPTPTQKLYGEIHELDQIHDQAISNMVEGYRTQNRQLIIDAELLVDAIGRAMPRLGHMAYHHFISKVLTPQGGGK